jgi:hypothetical protein
LSRSKRRRSKTSKLNGKYGEEGISYSSKSYKRARKLQEELKRGKIKAKTNCPNLALRYD